MTNMLPKNLFYVLCLQINMPLTCSACDPPCNLTAVGWIAGPPAAPGSSSACRSSGQSCGMWMSHSEFRTIEAIITGKSKKKIIAPNPEETLYPIFPRWRCCCPSWPGFFSVRIYHFNRRLREFRTSKFLIQRSGGPTHISVYLAPSKLLE